MSEKICAVCGKVLSPEEIKINERKIRPTLRRARTLRKKRYLCSLCRKKDYEQYMKEIKDLIKKY